VRLEESMKRRKGRVRKGKGRQGMKIKGMGR